MKLTTNLVWFRSQEWWSYTFICPYAFMVWCVIKKGGNFTLPLPMFVASTTLVFSLDNCLLYNIYLLTPLCPVCSPTGMSPVLLSLYPDHFFPHLTYSPAGNSMFLQNTCICLPSYKALHPRRLQFSYSPLSKPHISPRLKVFGNRFCRRICWPKREEVMEGYRKFHNGEFHNL